MDAYFKEALHEIAHILKASRMRCLGLSVRLCPLTTLLRQIIGRTLRTRARLRHLRAQGQHLLTELGW